MAKRFTDTDKWKDEWYISLSNDYRMVWQYMLDNCSIAGIFKKNFKMLNFCCGVNLDEKSLLEIFAGRIFNLGEYYFIPKFLSFQYPAGLGSQKPLIVSVRNELLEKKLIDNDNLIIKERLQNDCQIVKVMVKETVMEQETVTRATPKIPEPTKKNPDPEVQREYEVYPTFDDFWEEYDKKICKEKCRKKWASLSLADRELIMEHIPKYKDSKPQKQYRKDPETYLNNKSWNDEIIYRTNGQITENPDAKIGRIPVSHAKEFLNARSGEPTGFS